MEEIGIVKLNYSNIKSLCYSLDSLKINYSILQNAKDIKNFKKIILPGTSSFSVSIDELKSKSFDQALKEHVSQNKYLLGICVGMQLLFSYGFEGGKSKGLNFIKGSVISLNADQTQNDIFHIGWNNLKINKEIMLLDDVDEKENFYFVHSFHCVPNENIKTSKTFFNNKRIVSVVNKNKIYGIQFHPEKSHIPGIKILKNFSEFKC